MNTYVDDCDLDAVKPLRALVWKVVRTKIAAKDPVHMQKFLGFVREAWNGTSSCRGLRLTQSDYTAEILEDAVKLGFGPIRICTTAGESGTPPDPKPLLEQPCDPGVRELIGSLLFLSRCTRFDLSFVIARLARFVTRCCEWARKEIRHILGFVAYSSGWSLIMKSADDDWEELRLSTFCDASFGTRCFGGYKVKLTGSRGSSFLIEWASRLQGPQSTSLTESESIEWRRVAKAMLRVKGALDACRLKTVPCDGYVDNDALRLTVQRGSSAKLGHLLIHAETCFRFLAQLPFSMHRVGTAENEGDIMTKVLSAVRHRELCSVMPHAKTYLQRPVENVKVPQFDMDFCYLLQDPKRKHQPGDQVWATTLLMVDVAAQNPLCRALSTMSGEDAYLSAMCAAFVKRMACANTVLMVDPEPALKLLTDKIALRASAEGIQLKVETAPRFSSVRRLFRETISRRGDEVRGGSTVPCGRVSQWQDS